MAGIFEAANSALRLRDPHDKCEAALALGAISEPDFDGRDAAVQPIGNPGRPGLPELVEPGKVPRRRPGSDEGRAALIHAIAHIEFNAINLALDAAYRFRHLPEQFTIDWLSVAADEARHFRLLQARLSDFGYCYGDFPAHDGLWDMARVTSTSCLERMALVPRVLEARGLDVTPGMIQRLRSLGDKKTVSILNLILEEEVRHVAIGTHWFRYCCSREARDPLETFLELLEAHFGKPRGPFNIDARLLAGFTREELEALEERAA